MQGRRTLCCSLNTRPYFAAAVAERTPACRGPEYIAFPGPVRHVGVFSDRGRVPVGNWNDVMTLAGLRIKRVYEPSEETDGLRFLVDRVWPRGVSKSEAHIDGWLKDLAPSTDLRKWFGHDPRRWEAFCKRYARELKPCAEELDRLRKLCETSQVTLVYGARDVGHNNAVALRQILMGERGATISPNSE